MRHLEIKHLRMIAAIAETGNMTKAAARLFLSQSALSQQLKDIEDKLQAALFFRTRKVMLLTPVGRKLLESAKQVIQTLEDADHFGLGNRRAEDIPRPGDPQRDAVRRDRLPTRVTDPVCAVGDLGQSPLEVGEGLGDRPGHRL